VDAVEWTQTAWLQSAHGWILAELERLGLAPTGPIEQPHVRPWSTVLRVPTGGGDLWFKANMPALAREAAVVSVLVRRRPDCVPELLAADLERGWMLLGDGGTRLREAGLDVACWEEVLARYAQLQLDLVADRDELLAAGAPDRRLAVLPVLYEELVAGEHPLLQDEELTRLRTLTPRIAELCEELAAFGLPETIQHDDLHDGQVFVRDGRYLFFDWAEACVAHPFFTLTVTLGVLGNEPERFRDAYLEPWTRIAPREELLAAFPTAYLLGGVCRALTWRAVIEGMPAPFAAEWADMVPARLRLLLEQS
jgi:hypothetical protein